MAQVDFSNAVLSFHSYNPLSAWYVGLRWSSYVTAYITDDSGNVITSSLNVTQISRTVSYLKLGYSGTFSASGNEFYLATQANAGAIHYKISNVSFNSGDSFYFEITANLST